jgi:FKBP-type peptidyl-prolyl cis-trans isomerase FkpA
MKYTTLILASCALLASIDTAAQTKKKPITKKPATHTKAASTTGSQKWTKDADGLESKVITHGKGLVTPQIGDMVEIHVIQKIDDSLMMDSYQRNMGKPIAFQCQPPTVKGDVMNGIMKMKVGDSTIFRIPLDTLAARAKQPRPEWAKKNAYISWAVKLTNIKDKKEVEADMKKQQAEMEKMRAEAGEKAKVQAVTDDKLIQDYLKAKGITNAKKTASGLYYVIHKEGTGPNAAAGQKVTVNYTGVNLTGEKFDSNVDPAFNHVEPFKFDLGTHSVISGWDEGVALLNKGSKATLYIPSGMAYGPNARGPQIPANAILIFDIELLDFQ